MEIDIRQGILRTNKMRHTLEVLRPLINPISPESDQEKSLQAQGSTCPQDARLARLAGC